MCVFLLKMINNLFVQILVEHNFNGDTKLKSLTGRLAGNVGQRIAHVAVLVRVVHVVSEELTFYLFSLPVYKTVEKISTFCVLLLLSTSIFYWVRAGITCIVS